MNIELIFARNLIKQLKNKKYKQKDLAKFLEISTSAVSAWCTGKASPTLNKIDKIAHFLECSRNDLLLLHEEDLLNKENIIFKKIQEDKLYSRICTDMLFFSNTDLQKIERFILKIKNS